MEKRVKLTRTCHWAGLRQYDYTAPASATGTLYINEYGQTCIKLDKYTAAEGYHLAIQADAYAEAQ